jgi:hypothetical protein
MNSFVSRPQDSGIKIGENKKKKNQYDECDILMI